MGKILDDRIEKAELKITEISVYVKEEKRYEDRIFSKRTCHSDRKY